MKESLAETAMATVFEMFAGRVQSPGEVETFKGRQEVSPGAKKPPHT